MNTHVLILGMFDVCPIELLNTDTNLSKRLFGDTARTKDISVLVQAQRLLIARFRGVECVHSEIISVSGIDYECSTVNKYKSAIISTFDPELPPKADIDCTLSDNTPAYNLFNTLIDINSTLEMVSHLGA